MSLLLASASPRRAELLAAAGFSFEVVPADVDERLLPGESPEAHVARLSVAKARAVATVDRDVVVVGADTVVVVDGDVLGKPADDAEAAAMLERLSGRVHDVLTGLTVRRGQIERTAVERTAVRFAALSAIDLAWYVASGEPRDKAGAYGVQGLASRFITRVEGSYSNVVGLPVATLCRLLADIGAVEVEPAGSPDGRQAGLTG